MIIWINGPFAAGKTTLAGELVAKLPGAVLLDPEDVGLMLWKWIPPGEDFQDLPSWRELVAASALSMLRHHADTLVVPMTLTRKPYRREVFDALAEAGESVVHVYLDAHDDVLRERLTARTPSGANPGAGEAALAWATARIDAAADARSRLPADTFHLRSDLHHPGALADLVLVEVRRRAGGHRG